MIEEKDICPMCRFPSRISGHVFITKSLAEWDSVTNHRCPICRHLPDYIITDALLKRARIIYRKFNGAKKYFSEVTKYLEDNGFEVIKPKTQSD